MLNNTDFSIVESEGKSIESPIPKISPKITVPKPIYGVCVRKDDLTGDAWIENRLKASLQLSVNIVLDYLGNNPKWHEIRAAWIDLKKGKVSERTSILLNGSFFNSDKTYSFAELAQSFERHEKIRQKALRKSSLIRFLHKWIGPLQAADLDCLNEDFTRSEKARLTIFWNDRNDHKNLPNLKLPEDSATTLTRQHIENQNRRINDFQALASFLEKLSFWAHHSVEEFHTGLSEAMWFDVRTFPLTDIRKVSDLVWIDWRDYPKIVQFAVWENVLVPDPLREDRSCLKNGWVTSEQFAKFCKEFHIGKWIGSLNKKVLEFKKMRDNVNFYLGFSNESEE